MMDKDMLGQPPGGIMAAKKTYIFELTEEQVNAIIQVSLHLCDDLGPPKKFTTLGHFSEAGVALDEGKTNQDRTWERCVCDGSGWVEEGSELHEKLKSFGLLL